MDMYFMYVNYSTYSMDMKRIVEYLVLEGTHKDHQANSLLFTRLPKTKP